MDLTAWGGGRGSPEGVKHNFNSWAETKCIMGWDTFLKMDWNIRLELLPPGNRYLAFPAP